MPVSAEGKIYGRIVTAVLMDPAGSGLNFQPIPDCDTGESGVGLRRAAWL